MKIAVIHGQQRKGNTYHITQMLLSKLITPESDFSEFCERY